MSIRSEQAFQHPGPADRVFAATCQALVSLTMTITFADPASGTIRASSGMTMFSWGENLELNVIPVGAEATAVSMGSGLKFGLIDWGKNRKNIERIHQAIGAALTNPVAVSPVPAVPTAAQVPAGAWHPDPVGRHQFRWWDGQRWTDAVSDDGATSTDPLG